MRAAKIAAAAIVVCGSRPTDGFQTVGAASKPFSRPALMDVSFRVKPMRSTERGQDELKGFSKLDDSSFDFDVHLDRRAFLATSAAAAGVLLMSSQPAIAETSTANPVPLPWEANPVNKRSGVTVFDAEKAGYNVAFVTYCSRFLLNFDTNCQKYWFSSAKFPKTATAKEVEQIRQDQFAAFSASVEVGLIEYEGADGPEQLLQDLVRKYGTLPSSFDSSDDEATAKQKRIAKAARRHIALMFGLLEKTQPTKEVTKLLASVDNGSVSSVQLHNETALDGYEMGYEPHVTFQPPQAGDDYKVAEGKAFLKPTGGVLRVDILKGGGGYKNPPEIIVSPPMNEGSPAKLQFKVSKGILEGVKILDPGTGYTSQDNIQITIAPSPGGEIAVVKPVLNMKVDRIEVAKGGSGYAFEKPLKVFVTPPETMAAKKNETVLAGVAFPVAEKTSFASFRRESDSQRLMDQEATFESKYNLKEYEASAGIEGLESGGSPLPFWAGRSSASSQLLRLLPAGVGLEYDTILKRYALAMDTDFMSKYPAVLQQGSNRVIGTEFGPRGRAPIERNMVLGPSTYLRFWLSGATCASLVHTALTPLDVAKTRLQTAPEKYPTMGTAFSKIVEEDGPSTFFTGWLPTLLGNFLAGGAMYAMTEFVRRSLSEAVGVDAVALEVPIILAGAAVASTLHSMIYCPFEAVRIRTVAQPDFAPTSVDVFKKMLEEEGVGSLIDAIPVFLIKNIPYAMTKFLIFDLSTERMYEAFPAAQEDIKLSLLVSLIGGILGGTAAACVSNPADAVISELKKTKSDISPQEAVASMLQRNGISTFFVGLPLRMLFYSLIASMTFVVYDLVRLLLQVGSDDLKLYLDVLGGSLGNPPS